jgi:cytochrome oxidase Cu insertion factor (SCO1/SenC/PrrC family)
MNRVAIIAVFAIFLIPVVLATLMHSEWLDWQPGGGRNHGELIEPVIELSDFSVTDARNNPVSRQSLQDQWQLIHVFDGACGDTCLENLYWLRQVRLSQDRHQPEIALLFLSPTDQSPQTVDAIHELAEDYRVLDGEDAMAVLEQLPEQDRQGGFYIADPLANIILRYSSDADHNGIRRDLSRLVTWTQRE